jgi:hypothetical protein
MLRKVSTRTALGWTTALLLSTGCGLVKTAKDGDGDGADVVDDVLPDDEPGDERERQRSPLGLTGSLEQLKDCKAVEANIEARLVADMERDLDRQLYWAEHYDERGMGNVGSMESDDSAEPQAAGAANDGAAESSEPDDVTTTNNQVEGVEEADFVKNTGTHIYHVSNGKLRIMKSWPADALAMVSETKLEGRPYEMLLDGESRLVVFAHPMRKDVVLENGENGAKGEADVAGPLPQEGSYWSWDWESTEVSVYDVSNAAKPKRTALFRLRGSYLSSRRVESSVRIVMQSYRPYPEGVQTWLDGGYAYYDEHGNYQKPDIAALRQRIAEVKAKNRDLIEGQSLAYWLDSEAYVKVTDDGEDSLVDLESCTNVYAPTVETEFGFTRIATLDLDGETMTETMLLTYASQIYASQESLYLTTPYWWWDADARDGDVTWIHKFDIADPKVAAYEGSGGVQGMLLNQFAMDEHEGDLRVATTVSALRKVKADDACEGDICETVDSWTTTNRVSVLRPEGKNLALLGETPDLADGESIYAVRFHGPRGYVVTFRQVDPLFTLDLSNPKKPRVVGELKIPGFSSYLHFVDSTHLLAIGMEGDEDGRISGMKLSVFDVSDLEAPKESHKLLLEGSSWSEAQYNHKAFTFFRSQGLLAIPTTGYKDVDATGETDVWWGRWYSALQVFKVDVDAGIEQLGEVDVSDIYAGSEHDRDWWVSGATVRRSIFASEGDDTFVYAIADLGVRATDVGALGKPLATVEFGCDAACYGSWWWWY